MGDPGNGRSWQWAVLAMGGSGNGRFWQWAALSVPSLRSAALSAPSLIYVNHVYHLNPIRGFFSPAIAPATWAATDLKPRITWMARMFGRGSNSRAPASIAIITKRSSARELRSQTNLRNQGN